MPVRSATPRPKRHRRRFRLVSISFRMVLTVAAAALGLSYLSVFINPARFSAAAFFGLYFIPVAGINLLLLLLALIRRSRSVFIPLVALLPSLLFIEYYFRLGEAGPDRVEGAEHLSVLTYNVGRFSADTDRRSRRECQQDILDFIREEDPDIVCLQEFYISDPERLGTILGQYPYRHRHLYRLGSGGYFGNLTVSKYPILNSGKISFRGSANLSLWTDIRIGRKTVRVYNNHLESFNISFTSLIKKIGNGPDELSEELVELHGKMNRSNLKRVEQVDIVLEHIRNSPCPAIICGDFNDTPMSYTFRRMRRGRLDTFQEAGNGFAATYSTFWPLLRIDYVLVPEDFGVLSHRTPRIPWSDHYPVSARLYLAP